MGDNYNLILVIINQFTKMFYYIFVMVTNNILDLINIDINIMISHHGLPNLIIINLKFYFTLKFCLLLYYFFDNMQKLFIIFYFLTDR